MTVRTLVVTDLDGTLWDTDLACHPASLEAFAALEADPAIGLLAATGRRRRSAQMGMEANGILLPAVVLNGAMGVDYARDTVFHRHAHDPETAAVVVELLADHGLSPCLHTDDGLVHVDENPSTSPRHMASVGADLGRHETLGGIVDRAAVLCMTILGVGRHRLEAATDALVRGGVAEVALYEDHLFEGWSLMVQPAGVSKWSGINAWRDYAGVTPERVIAVGDGGNDLEMLAAADLAISIHGGDPRAMAMADHVLAPPERGGWAAIVDLLAG